MVHTYRVKGMTCGSCEKRVSNILKSIPGVADVKVNRQQEEVVINMTRHVDTSELKQALEGSGYSISEDSPTYFSSSSHSTGIKEEYSYKPIYLIFGYLTAATLLIQIAGSSFSLSDWFRQYMAGFFLVFSFFKMLDLKAFAAGYSTYDVIAKKVYGYGYVYPFIELALGFGFLIPQWHTVVNVIALIVMSISIIGVIQSMKQKRVIQCACLGTIFKLPLSKVTLFEDGLMIVMSAASLTLLNNHL